MSRQCRDNRSRQQRRAPSKYQPRQNKNGHDRANCQHRWIPGGDHVQQRFRRRAEARHPRDQSQQPVVEWRCRGILHLSKKHIRIHHAAPREMPHQILRHAHVVPRVSFLEVHKAWLKHQIEPRDDANGQGHQTERGHHNPLAAVQDGRERSSARLLLCGRWFQFCRALIMAYVLVRLKSVVPCAKL